jgi:hypothetical protein
MIDAQHGSADNLLTLEQVAKRINASKDWVRDHATRRNPRIRSVRMRGEGAGNRGLMRFRPRDIDAFVNLHLSSDTDFHQNPVTAKKSK